MKRWAYRAFLSSVLGLSLIASACGSSGGGSPSAGSTAKGTITVGGFNFTEGAIAANLYGQALKGQGWTVNYRLNLGNREVVAPALEKGDIDLYPGYAATDLEFFNSGKGEATPDANATVAKLNTYLTPKGEKALAPSPALDINVFVLSKQASDKYHVTRLSELAPLGGQLTLGGPAECPKRPFCQAGLESKYGIHFKSFKALDGGGPLTKAALDKGDVDVALLFSTDVAVKKYTLLSDDKQLQNADNVVPIVRTKTVSADAQTVLNQVSAKLTTDDLAQLDAKVDSDKQDPDKVAGDWLKSHGFKT